MSATFFDLPAKLSNYETAAVVILPVPLDLTTSYVKGTARAPQAIFEASHQVELYDEELGFEPCQVGIAALPPLNVEKLPLEEAIEEVGRATAKIVADGKLPVIIGGEHSITPKAVAQVAKAHPNLTVLQLDAHADLREEYSGTKWSHACSMARVREICPAVQVGIRNLSKEEAQLVSQNKLPVFFAHRLKENKKWMEDVIKAIKTPEVYVTLDVDAFDSSLLPDTGTPEPGGLDWYEVVGLIRAVSLQKKIVGFDFVELTPQEGHHASDFLVAKLIYKCIGYWASKAEAKKQ